MRRQGGRAAKGMVGPKTPIAGTDRAGKTDGRGMVLVLVSGVDGVWHLMMRIRRTIIIIIGKGLQVTQQVTHGRGCRGGLET